jgi:NAD(P)-dependent dehydrogenase (short-subunit alcohol dehydrogenase family)
MELRDRTVMILGGSGLVGHAVARRLLDAGRVERDPVLRSHILSVGIPILTPGRAQEMVAQAERRAGRAADSGSDVDWTAIGADEPIEPARFVTWVFRFEDRGERIKR